MHPTNIPLHVHNTPIYSHGSGDVSFPFPRIQGSGSLVRNTAGEEEVVEEVGEGDRGLDLAWELLLR